MNMMEKMMEFMMGRMSKEEKEEMMDKMMGNFFADMTKEDKENMMENMMPKMMEGVNMMEMMPKMMMGEEGMMSKMMQANEGAGMSMMPNMMMEMMPNCLNIMLPNVPAEERTEFVLKMVEVLVEKGSQGMSEDERTAFVSSVMEKVR
ncbi:MAG: hypothetical protein QCH31_05785 [Methanolobus sp.]|nr:hypothetical protein [Methanolobus sp.]